jgi:hypothetical protein
MQRTVGGHHKSSQYTCSKGKLVLVAAPFLGGIGASCLCTVQVSSRSRIKEPLMTRPVLATNMPATLIASSKSSQGFTKMLRRVVLCSNEDEGEVKTITS